MNSRTVRLLRAFRRRGRRAICRTPAAVVSKCFVVATVVS
jgi:hypothetical protein